MVCNNLKKLRSGLNLSQKAIGEALGIAQTTYANYESGKANIPDELKIALSTKYQISIHWLITGEGPMYLGAEPKVLNCEENNATYITTSGKSVTQEIPDGCLSVPILTQKLSAGPGQPWTQADIVEGERLPIIGRFIKPWHKDRVYAAEVRGDSMTGIQLFDGDMVFFVRGEVEGDGLYVLSVDNEIFVKRVSFNPFDKKITIKSENERYEPMTVDSDRATLLGKVIGWLHHHPY